QLRLRYSISLQLPHAQDAQCQHRGGREPDCPWSFGDAGSETRPEAFGIVCWLVGGVEGGTPRPERRTSERVQHRRQEGKRRQHGERYADGSYRPQRRVGPEVAEQQAQQAGYDGAARSQYRLERTAHSAPDGSPSVLDLTQLFTETSDEQQRVVGGCTYHQDEQDALRLAAQQQDTFARQQPHRQQGRAQREEAGAKNGHWQQQ